MFGSFSLQLNIWAILEWWLFIAQMNWRPLSKSSILGTQFVADIEMYILCTFEPIQSKFAQLITAIISRYGWFMVILKTRLKHYESFGYPYPCSLLVSRYQSDFLVLSYFQNLEITLTALEICLFGTVKVLWALFWVWICNIISVYGHIHLFNRQSVVWILQTYIQQVIYSHLLKTPYHTLFKIMRNYELWPV